MNLGPMAKSPNNSLAAAILLRSLVMLLVAAATLPRPSAAQSYPEPRNGQQLPEGSWRFIVSGDSRNCGDVVMPAIAAHSARFAASFYWHLGDLRAIYKVDEDMAFEGAISGQFLSCSLYLQRAWPDFIEHQIAAFGNLPYYVGIGNHEIIPPKDKLQFRQQFAAWLDQKSLHNQRAKDEAVCADEDAAARDGKKHEKKATTPPLETPPPTCYHWVQDGVDFIYLDNSTDYFPDAELKWLENILKNDETSGDVKSVVVGMHEALPDSIANHHSMGDSKVPEARPSGEKAYDLLQGFRDRTHKHVYVLASHSHFYMENIFDTPELRKKGEPLRGWIVGTGGAERYRLPVPAPEGARKDVYGYLVGTVADGNIQFAFQEVREQDVPQTTRRDYPAPFIHWCFAHNSQNTDPDDGEITPHCAPPPCPKCEKKEPAP